MWSQRSLGMSYVSMIGGFASVRVCVCLYICIHVYELRVLLPHTDRITLAELLWGLTLPLGVFKTLHP